MAFIRHLEDSAIVMRIVLLDNTPVPLMFRPFLHSRKAATARDAVELLEGRPAPDTRSAYVPEPQR